MMGKSPPPFVTRITSISMGEGLGCFYACDAWGGCDVLPALRACAGLELNSMPYRRERLAK